MLQVKIQWDVTAVTLIVLVAVRADVLHDVRTFAQVAALLVRTDVPLVALVAVLDVVTSNLTMCIDGT